MGVPVGDGATCWVVLADSTGVVVEEGDTATEVEAEARLLDAGI